MHIIIGQGAAGTAAARALRRFAPSADVLVLSAEKNGFYNRIALPDVIAGKTPPEAIGILDDAGFVELGIKCRSGARVLSLDTKKHVLRLEDGEELGYKKLLLATGSLSALPPIEGRDAAGVYSLWTLDDARAIMAAADKSEAAVVVGAGLIGLKTALALKKQGLAVTVVEQMPRVMPRQLDNEAAAMVETGLRSQGLSVLTGTSVQAIRRQKGRVSGVVLEGRELACDMVIMAVGVIPDTRLAREAGLEVRRGIVTDKNMQSSAPDVFAAGDAAESVDILSADPVVPAIWPVAVEQGKAAAASMAGLTAPAFAGSVAMNSVEVGGVTLASIGDIAGAEGDTVRIAREKGAYRRLVFRDGIVRGVLCIGDISPVGILGAFVEQRRALPACNPLARRFSFGDILCPEEHIRILNTGDAHAH